MKEQIYTIPVNEVYDTDCECPLCELEKKLEKETLDYALGAAMMEPEFRMESNEKGFCNHHYSMLFGMSNKLALSLVLDTHLVVLLDESTASICSKLFFLESDDRELAATALYTLPSVQGNFLMLPNTEGEESEINLELLFGAVLAEPGKIAEMFHTKTNE